MVGSGLKKLAQEYGMNIAEGVAYGNLDGYAATFFEGSGYKQIVFTTKFQAAGDGDSLQEKLNSRNIAREFRVQRLNITPDRIDIVFLDNPGTMKKIREFLELFLPLLKESSATAYNICTECGCEVTAGKWLLINGVAFYMHESCAQKVRRLTQEEEAAASDADTGSYVRGFLGALGGAAMGSVVWAVVLNLGYVASIVGLLIGWLAEKGYRLFRGRQGKGKVLILALVIILAVLAGTVAADVFTLAGMIGRGELPGFGYGDILPLMLYLLEEDPEYAGATVSNILTGLLFAALGVYALLRKAGKEVAGTKFKYLN